MPEGTQTPVSMVVPVYNEVDNVRPLVEAIAAAMGDTPYEIVLVNDGSTDGSDTVLNRMAEEDATIRVVHFVRNYGQTAALTAGIRHAKSPIIVTLDADLQNDPADIPAMLNKLDDADVVCGWRRNRQDRVATRLLPSRIANFLIARVTGARIHDTGCSLKVYRSWVVRSLHLYSDMHRFLAALGVGLGGDAHAMRV